EFVEAGEPLVRVVSIDRLRVEGLITAPEASRIVLGQRAAFREKGSQSNWELVGKVTFLSPEIHPVSGMCRVWVEVSNSDQLARAGMRGELKIEADQTDR
ncbi:MAG: HlyD family secretion protein, partial [Planctomycetota bacterium]